jgi:hypothetical protein
VCGERGRKLLLKKICVHQRKEKNIMIKSDKKGNKIKEKQKKRLEMKV